MQVITEKLKPVASAPHTVHIRFFRDSNESSSIREPVDDFLLRFNSCKAMRFRDQDENEPNDMYSIDENDDDAERRRREEKPFFLYLKIRTGDTFHPRPDVDSGDVRMHLDRTQPNVTDGDIFLWITSINRWPDRSRFFFAFRWFLFGSSLDLLRCSFDHVALVDGIWFTWW